MSSGGGDEIQWYPAAPVNPGWNDPAPAPTPHEGPAYAYLGGPPPTPSRKRRLPVVLVALVAAAVVAVVLVVVAPGGGKSAQAAVIASVNQAVNSKTARGTLTMTIASSGNGPARMVGSGTGALDFASGAMDFNLGIHIGNIDQPLSIRVIYLGGTIYENIPQIGELLPGKTWISLDFSGLAKAASGSGGTLEFGGNPAAMLRLLGQQGNSVVPLGSSKINGVTVNGYRVTFDPASMKSKLDSANIPSWMRDAVNEVNLQNATEEVYIDGSGQLRRTAMHVDVSGPSGKSGSVDETFDLSDFGAPVTISAPPANQVADFQQFLQSIKGASSN